MHEQTIKGKWQEIKGEVQKMWGKLTDSELEQTKGDSKAIAGLVRQRYGQSKEDFDKKFGQIVDRFSEKKDEITGNVKENLKQSH